eukprot:COSAG01_NODE_47598_length_388_cov_18.134948_1_plen_22_part_01
MSYPMLLRLAVVLLRLVAQRRQ